jgi:hypothetical protein
MFPSGSCCRRTFRLYNEQMNLAARILMRLLLAMANGLQSVLELVLELATEKENLMEWKLRLD